MLRILGAIQAKQKKRGLVVGGGNLEKTLRNQQSQSVETEDFNKTNIQLSINYIISIEFLFYIFKIFTE